MELLDILTITRGEEKRSLELWYGDLANIPASEAVDILVVSARPNDFLPIRGTLIEALDKKGISLQALSEHKQVDLTQTCSCWLSSPIHSHAPGIEFKQILCFEPHRRDHPEEVVGDIFRSLVPFVCGHDPLTSVAMPLVSTGKVHVPMITMLEALFDAATGWLEHGLPLKRLKIVEFNREKALEMKGAFAMLKRHYERESRQEVAKPPKYDVFISYCHKNSEQMEFVANELKQRCPGIRLFVDQQELQPGMAWQQALYQSIDDSRKVLALYSPEYLASKACQEEYNIARVLHRQSEKGVLFPIYLYTADLPPYMQTWQYHDCREAKQEKLQEACLKIIKELI